MLWLLLTSCVWITAARHEDGLDGDGDGLSVFDDCDDADPGIGGPADLFVDADGDGFGAMDAGWGCPDVGFALEGGDCDDLRADVFPGAIERCDPLGIDEDCDGDSNDVDAEGVAPVYTDADGDGYGAGAPVTQACTPGPGQALVDGDCDDDDPTVSPGHTERCGGGDEDCDGQVDESGSQGWYFDGDGDGWGAGVPVVAMCSAPITGYVAATGDCDDLDLTVHPTASEHCNGRDDDCNGLVDDAAMSWADADGDGFGAGTGEPGCASGRVTDDSDCDDRLDDVYPNAPTGGGDVDHDCDGVVDDDEDGDGYSAEASGGSDCDDTDPSTYPGEGCEADAPSCRVLYERGETGEGPWTLAGDPPYETLCEMDGGWTLVARSGLASEEWSAAAVEDLSTFGVLEGEADLKTAAHHALPVTELRFVDAEGMWAEYVVASSPTAILDQMAMAPHANCAPGQPMVAGDLSHPALCTTDLYVHARDSDGRGCETSEYSEHAVGFGWSRDRNGGCPFDDTEDSSFVVPLVPWTPPVQMWAR